MKRDNGSLIALIPSNDLTVVHIEDAAGTALGDKGCLEFEPCSHRLSALAAVDDGGVCHTFWYAKIDDAAVMAHEFVIEFLGHEPNSPWMAGARLSSAGSPLKVQRQND